MTTSQFKVSPAAQREYRVLSDGTPTGADEVARQALQKARADRQPDPIHVTKRTDGWALKTAGRERATTVKPTKAAAMDAARETAAKRGARVVEHGRDGKIVHNTKPRQR